MGRRLRLDRVVRSGLVPLKEIYWIPQPDGELSVRDAVYNYINDDFTNASEGTDYFKGKVWLRSWNTEVYVDEVGSTEIETAKLRIPHTNKTMYNRISNNDWIVVPLSGGGYKQFMVNVNTEVGEITGEISYDLVRDG